MDTNKALALAFREARERAQLRALDISVAVLLTESHVAKVERGDAGVRACHVDWWAGACGIEAASILRRAAEILDEEAAQTKK